MAHEIVVPRLGWSMEEGVFVRWLKQDGDTVRVGEAIFEFEGEKALQEIESIDAGILRIPPDAPPPGSVVLVGRVVGYLVAEGEATPESSHLAPRDDLPLAQRAVQNERIESTSPATTTRIVASPRARRIAKELGVEWQQLAGSGANGRIRECDVRAASSANPSRGVRVPISARRRVIAERMVASRQQTVPVTITTRADATQLIALREQFKSPGAAIVPSYQDLIIKLVAGVLERHPLLAGRWEQDAIVLPANDELHIGMAVDTSDGLVVPVIRNGYGLSIAELAAESRRLIERATAGKLTAAEMQGGIFTVTNLGAFGIDAFTPIINFPESAILGLGAIRREAVVLDDGQIVARHQLTLSLTFDHRIIDGAPAARFLRDVAAAIADPPSYLQSVSM